MIDDRSYEIKRCLQLWSIVVVCLRCMLRNCCRFPSPWHRSLPGGGGVWWCVVVCGGGWWWVYGCMSLASTSVLRWMGGGGRGEGGGRREEQQGRAQTLKWDFPHPPTPTPTPPVLQRWSEVCSCTFPSVDTVLDAKATFHALDYVQRQVPSLSRPQFDSTHGTVRYLAN